MANFAVRLKDLLKIGTGTLNTVAQTLVAAVNELHNGITASNNQLQTLNDLVKYYNGASNLIVYDDDLNKTLPLTHDNVTDTFKINSSGSVQVFIGNHGLSGTFDYPLVNQMTLAPGQYRLMGCPDVPALANKISLKVTDGGNNVLAKDTGAGATFTVAQDEFVTVSMELPRGTNIASIWFYPCLMYDTLVDLVNPPGYALGNAHLTYEHYSLENKVEQYQFGDYRIGGSFTMQMFCVANNELYGIAPPKLYAYLRSLDNGHIGDHLEFEDINGSHTNIDHWVLRTAEQFMYLDVAQNGGQIITTRPNTYYVRFTIRSI